MIGEFEFLTYFPKDQQGLFIVYELYTFDNFFRLLMQHECSYHDEALEYMIANCSLSAVVFQKRKHNNKYRLLDAKDAISPFEASINAKLKADLLACADM
ncbi:hypothetical protein GF337_06085 [candidate division KSB1 bacterium]|nr:hypothetical protein [candidate division KSB1 bacterium]